jgi:tetratricopeptide (TPR) repeat protein
LFSELAGLFSDQGRQSEAMGLNDQALAIERKLYGNDGPELVAVLEQRAVLLQRSGRLGEAETLNRAMLATRIKHFGPDSLEAANCRGNLANILEDQGKFAEAETIDRQLLELCRKTVGEEGVNYAEGLCNLAGVLRGESKLAEAEADHRAALQKLRAVMGDTHPYVTTAANELVVDLMLEHKADGIRPLLDLLLKPEFVQNPDPGYQANLKAEYFAKKGLWTEAVVDARQAVNLQPTNHFFYHTLAPLLAAERDFEAYRKCCLSMADHFGGTADPYVADRMAKDSLIFPLPGMDLTPVGELAETAVTKGKNLYAFPFFCCSQALAEYRMTHYAGAIEWATKSLKSSYEYVDSEAYALLAMANFQLKHFDDARSYLALDAALVDHKMPSLSSGDLGNDWRDWIVSHALLEEARALILTDSAGNGQIPQL